MIGITLASIGLLAAGAMPSPAPAHPHVDIAIRERLRASSVPVLLPVPLPPALGPVRSIAVIDADASGYYVGDSPVARCGGALACAFFHVAGFPSSDHVDRAYRRERVVRLADGTRAYFRRSDCSGASCTEASLTFERPGALYEIDAKSGHDDLALLEDAYRRLRRIH
jgi:hypothetical protein